MVAASLISIDDLDCTKVWHMTFLVHTLGGCTLIVKEVTTSSWEKKTQVWDLCIIFRSLWTNTLTLFKLGFKICKYNTIQSFISD